MRIALAQVNTRIGDLSGNCDTIRGATDHAAGADLVVFPEMVLTGYPPRDLLCDPAFVARATEHLHRLAEQLAGGPPAVVGAPVPSGRSTPGHPGLYDAAVLLRGGEVAAVVPKRLLPAYDVFHEPRWFTPGAPSSPREFGDTAVGLLVCEDLWDEGYPAHPPGDLVAAGAEVLVDISASPFREGVFEERVHHAARAGCPVVVVNAVGAHDELIFDGRSFVTDAAGTVVARLPAFEEQVRTIELDAVATPPPEDADALLFDALVLGIRDFCWKNGLRDAWLGLSGGLDSAVVAALAAAALGPDHVHALALPSRFTDPRSTEAARELAGTLGIGLEVLPIEPLHALAEETLAPLVEGAPARDTTLENVQARLRMLLLTAHLNRHGGVLLNTSNKTELALGYGTLYGDLAGSLSPIGDLPKTRLRSLADWVHAHRTPLPSFVRERPPTAELRPGQVDPFDYDRIAPAAEALVQGREPAGLSDDERADLLGRYPAGEHKRWQHGVVLRVTGHAFGTGRLMPITRASRSPQR